MQLGDKNIKTIYTMVQEDINKPTIEYTPELKAELNRRLEYYLAGGKMVTPEEMQDRLTATREKMQ